MVFLKILVKFIIIILAVALMFAPVVVEVLNFRAEKKKKISYKRLRSMIFTVLYLFAVTIVMCFVSSFVEWLKTTSLIEWLIEKFSFNGVKSYAAQVYCTIVLNFLICLIYVLLNRAVNVGVAEKNLTVPKNADGKFSLFQKIERAIIRFFNTETWLFVGEVLKYFNIALFAVYGLSFMLYQIPALFAAKWIPYKFISSLFGAGYLYPIITLLGTLEFYFFLEGMKMLGNECPEISFDTEKQEDKTELCLETIDSEVKKYFKDFHASDVELKESLGSTLDVSEHDIITENIGKAVENDSRNSHKPKEVYLNCVDKLVKSDKSVLFNGSLFSEFSAYFLRYISIILARGDNVVFVCNSDLQTDDVYNYLTEGMSEVSSIYSLNKSADNFDNPIWKIVKIAEKHSAVNEACVDNASVLVTTLSYLCSDNFYTEHAGFINLIDTVVFVDSAETVNMFNRQMSILNTKIRHVSKKNAALSKNSKFNRMFKIRYTAKDIRYICFDNTRIPGLDKVLKNMLSVEFESQDATEYETTAMVRCYNYEAKCDENGTKACPQFLDTEEKVDVIMNMAVLCLANGADSVDVFPEGAVPYGNIAETVSSNLGQVLVNADGTNIRINKHRLNPERYHVILAMDSGNNLPAALRKYVSMASCAPALIVVFSKPYMLRDYYSANISSVWRNQQIEKIPVEGGSKKDIAQKILIKANAGGITKKEILRLASGDAVFDEFVAAEDINSILRTVLKICDISREDRIDLYKFFEYSSVRDFNDEGECIRTDIISLRKSGNLFECINGRDMAKMVCGDKEFVLPVPGKRITQRFISGQNLLYEGDVYNIQKIDTSNGKIYARRAVGGKNEEAYEYIQKKEYRVEIPAEKTEFVYPMKHVVLNSKSPNIEISDICVSGIKVPMDVLTKGYYETDPYTCDVSAGSYKYYSISDAGDDYLAKQTYRRYGTLLDPAYTTEEIVRDTTLSASENGAVVMALTMKGSFGPDKDKMVLLASVMLNELLRSMFPSVKNEIAVCPVIDSGLSYEGMESALIKQPTLILKDEKGYLPKDNFSLLIIEDSNTELGVVSSLMAAGDDIVNNLFAPIYKYLSWYLSSEGKSTYLYGGLQSEPECFDFNGLCEVCRLTSEGKHILKFTEIIPAIEYFFCDFCYERFESAHELTELKDGRKMCRKCANGIVGNDKKQTKQYLDRATAYLESAYGINSETDYTICFEETVKIINELEQNKDIVRGNFDIPLKSFVSSGGKISVECSVPSVSLSELLVRELTYAWQMKNLPELEPALAEGLIALVAVQYLNFARESTVAAARVVYYESTSNISGEGYRRLAAELIRNPKFKNNPFAYLIEICGKNSNDFMTELPEPKEPTSEFGNEYVPEANDRQTSGQIEYFYYSRINENAKKAYDVICAAALEHKPEVQLDCPFEDISTALNSIWYDRPDIFWIKSISVEQDKIIFEYAATAEEIAELQRRIDVEVPKFLEGIDNSMSAYDVALRIHDKVMRYVDYDTVTLNKEKENPSDYREIDYIRTICGVFLNGEAVCEGYARAVEYLLQKCGIECAEVGGTVLSRNGRQGGNHGWNIVKIDGEYYYLDTTWDDNSDTIQKVKRTDTGFSYFCVTTEELLRTRTIDLNPIDMPVCTATKANYYCHNNLVIDSYNLSQIKEFAKIAAQKKEKFFTFKCATVDVYEKAVKELCVVGDDCYDVIKAASKINKNILPGKYSFVNDDNIWTVSIYFKFE